MGSGRQRRYPPEVLLNLGDIFGKTFGTRSKPKRMNVADSHRVLVA